jgi:DNA-binding transcriptional ArsR family regulator
LAYREFTEKELEELKSYMYILNTLLNVQGAMYLQHMGRITHKSYEQVTRDIKELEELGLVKKEYVVDERNNKTLKSTIIFLTRKAYNRLGKDLKEVKGNEATLQKALLEGYLFLNYKEQYKKHEEIIDKIKSEQFLKDTTSIWKERHKHYFNILEDKNIIFTNYYVKKNIHYFDMTMIQTEYISVKKTIEIIEDLYLLFANCTTIDFKIKTRIVTRNKPINIKKTLNKIRRHRPKKAFHKKFRAIFSNEFRNNIEFYYIDLDSENKKYIFKKN